MRRCVCVCPGTEEREREREGGKEGGRERQSERARVSE